MNEFVLYKEFLTENDAKYLLQILDDNKIPFNVIDNSYAMDISIIGAKQQNFQVLLNPKNFDVVNSLLELKSKDELANLPSDYYLYSFSNDELFEILQTKDEWSSTDYILAHKLLEERGEKVTHEDLEKFNQERILKLSVPDNSSSLQIFLGYLFAIFGGLIGFVIGWYLRTAKKTLPNGKKVFSYQENDRKHGLIIFVISIIAVLFWTYYLYF